MTKCHTMALQKHFDQLMKVYKAQLTLNSTATISVEVDLELPRGYVAKIKIVEFQIRLVGVLQTSANIFTEFWTVALVKDPDDDTTVAIPIAEVQHDVIADFIANYAGILDTTNHNGAFIADPFRKIIYFNENEFDIITARNMRFNGTESADLDAVVFCTIYYTLEAIKKQETLELLDIL